MAEFAQFVAVPGMDDWFTVPTEPTESSTRVSELFDLPNLDSTRTVVLMFKVKPHGDVRLLMRFNAGSEHVIDFPLQRIGPGARPVMA
jgi:hypothetical protein